MQDLYRICTVHVLDHADHTDHTDHTAPPTHKREVDPTEQECTCSETPTSCTRNRSSVLLGIDHLS